MRNGKFYLCLILALTIVATTLHVNVMAQANTLNTFSTYSMYGLGELQSQGSLATRSMGSAGVAMRSAAMINFLNPASYSVALRKGVLFDFGAESGSYFSAQNIDGVKQTGSYTTANFQDIALQVPIAKGLGFGFSVTPFSSVGYRQLDTAVEPNLGYVNIERSGSGNISEVKFGLGWEVLKGLSFGFAAQYYWGTIERSFVAEVVSMTATSNSLSLSGVDNISVSSLKGQFGLQSEVANNKRRKITLGLTVDVGGELNPRYVRTVSDLYTTDEDTYAQNDTMSISIIAPRQLTAGVEYSNQKVVLVADLNYQGWGGQNSTVEYTTDGMAVAYNNLLMGRVGLEYTPQRRDVRRYLNRVNYRIGARYGGYQYTYQDEKIAQYAVTAGLGFPIRVVGISKINVGVEWGGVGSLKDVQVGSERIGLVRENHLKFALGFTLFGDDYWFVRPQID